MSYSYNLIKELSVLSQGRDPQWLDQPETFKPTLPPYSTGDGVNVEDALVALCGVTMWDQNEPYTKRVYAGIPFGDSSQTYTLTIGSTTISVTGFQAGDIMGDLLTAIQSDGSLDITVTAQMDDTGVYGTYLRLSGPDVANKPITFATTSSVAEVGVAAPATQAEILLWLYTGGQWCVPADGAFTIENNFVERAMVAGCSRVYIQVVATDGYLVPRIGPCVEPA